MSTITHALHWLFSPEVLLTILGAGLAVLTVTLLVLMRTRWGQAKPLSKCVFLSVFAHMLLVGYASITKVYNDLPPGPKGPAVTPIHIVAENTDAIGSPTASAEAGLADGAPWDKFATPDAPVEPQAEAADEEVTPDRETMDTDIDVQRAANDNTPTFAVRQPQEVALPHEMEVAAEQPQQVARLHREPTGAVVAEIEAPRTERRIDSTPAGPDVAALESPLPPNQASVPQRSDNGLPAEILAATPDVQRLTDVVPAIDAADSRPAIDDASGSTATDTLPPFGAARGSVVVGGQAIAAAAGGVGSAASGGAAGEAVASIDGATAAAAAAATGSRTASPRRLANGRPLPGIYGNRVEVDRGSVTRAEGGNERTEAAVAAALKWLAENQETDGRWDADKHGGGQETRVFGHDRQGAGARADTGVTALAVLALMASGHTHYEGEYRVNVQKGLEFLLRSQARDGSMAGGSETYAQMYCHGMATLAIAEAYAMTGDDRLKWWVEKAIGYSVSAQNSTDGGWRYRPGDAGDMSQFGWQVMAIKTAETSGIAVPDRTKQGMQRFLTSMSSGRHGGLASYRPREDVSPTMTAEALACRYFLGLANDDPTIDEAANYVVASRPQREKMNLYFWYYGTLAMHQVQGERWSQWNEALQTRLLPVQRQDGRLTGSWDPGHDLWGGYGGRVYTTAMGALCLESYYRFSLTKEHQVNRR